MDTSLLLTASGTSEKSFEFLYQYNYMLSVSKILDESTVEFIYINHEVRKEINIRIYNYDNVKRFFLTISVIRVPYVIVYDIVDFDTYLDKNHIKCPETLEGSQRNIENANKHIEEYVSLFKQYGIKLITTDKQSPHYFTEWT